MNKKEWIKEKLKENDYDNSTVYHLYEDFKQELQTTTLQGSYERLVRLYNKTNKKKVLEKEEYTSYSREGLIQTLTDYIENHKTKISMKALSNETNIPVGAFLKYVPDYNKIMTDFYKDHLLHIKDDVNLEKIKIKLKLLEKENKYLKSKEMEKDLLLEVVKDVAVVFQPFNTPRLINSINPTRIAQLLFSDSHFGDIVKKEQVLVNEYNPEIACKRIDSLFNQTLDYCEAIGTKILDINILGDLISGRIHQEILENTAFSTAEAVIKLADYIAEWIFKIVEEGYTIDNVRCMPGNHGRMTDKPNFDNKAVDNFEWFIYEFLKRRVEKIVNNFIMPQSMVHIADVFETRLGILHGDIFKGGTGLNPVSGTWGRDTAKLNALFNSNGKGFDILAFGHFHSGEMLLSGFDKTKIIVNGSIKGTDSFSIGAVKTGARPNQTIFCIEKGKKGETRFFQTLFLD